MSGSSQEDVAREFDHYRETYSQTVNDALIVPGLDVEYFTRVKADMLLEYAAAEIGQPRSLSVLDVGCGVGNYHGLLKNKIGRLVGVDVSSESIEKARLINPELEYEAYDGRTLPFDSDSFDIAYAICVVHHVPTQLWPNFFQELNRVIKPGGHAMIFEHNPSNPLTMRVVNNCPFDHDAVLLKRKKTIGLLNGAGFTQTKAISIINIPSFGPFTRKVDQFIGRIIPVGAQYLARGVKAAQS